MLFWTSASAQELAACPTEWMPWNYHETLHPTGKDPSVGTPDLERSVSLPDSAEL